MNRCLLHLIAIVVTFSGCTHTHMVSSYEEVNPQIADKKVFITLDDGVVVVAQNARVSEDSVRWLNINTGRKGAVATADIRDIVTKDHGRGAVEGLGSGFLGGFTFGALIGLASGDDEPDPSGWNFISFSAEEKALMGGAVLGAIGMAVGLPAGAAAGSRDVYVLKPPSE